MRKDLMDLAIMLDEYAREGNEEMVEKIRKEINNHTANNNAQK